MSVNLKTLAVAGLLAASGAHAVVTSFAAANASSALCSLLQAKYPQQVVSYGLTLNLTLLSDYQEATTRYWSQENADNVPQCVFLPTTANEVADAVLALNKYPTVPWAVKGGGHNPNKGYSSTSGGLLIALQSIAGVAYNPTTQVARVGAGARWGAVQTSLDQYNVAVVGGRLGDVGVGGFVLGGGLSFLSTKHGFTADTVTNFQVVTAAGEVTNANATSNTDLFYAMKGGGSQFAIVVNYDLQTYPVGRVWGGYRIYNISEKDALLSATHNLISNYDDPDAAVIVTFSSTVLDLVNIFVVFYFYNDPVGPGQILSEFLSIPAIDDHTSGNQTMGALLTSNSLFSLDGMRYLIRTGTLPNLAGAAGADLYNYTFNSWYDAVTPYFDSALDNFIFSFAFQPMPHQLQQASVSSPNGGNRLGLNPEHGDLYFLEYDVSWLLPTTDALSADIITKITQPVQDYARSKYANVPPTHYQSGNISETSYNPMYMNDGMYNQEILRSYGSDTYNKLAAIQKAVDPNGLFSTRTGGFKYT